MSDIHASTKHCNCQAKKQENPLFSFPRQTIDEELSLLVFKNKRKITSELLQETCGENNFLFLSTVLCLACGEQERSGLSACGVHEYYIGRTSHSTASSAVFIQ